MQFIDLQKQYEILEQDINARIQKVLNHGQFIMGPEVAQLEKELADFVGMDNCITCANGTDALQMAFMLYGVGPGDAVFCPDVTFIASVESAVMLGATPIFCDITQDTFTLCPESLKRQIKNVKYENKLTPKAVVAVDFLGNPADYSQIVRICKEHGLHLIEDAAQSFGAIYQSAPCGSFGDIATTSFFPAKPLGCYGDGGALFTNNSDDAEFLRSIRVHGKGPLGKYNNIRVGINSRLDTIQAAILLEKLSAFKKNEQKARQVIADKYDQAFQEKFVTQRVTTDAQSVYAQYALLASNTGQRDIIMSHLDTSGIPSMIYYPTPQHLLPVFSGCPTYNEVFPNASRYCDLTFSIPMHPYLMQEEQEFIIQTVLTALKQN